MWKKSIDKVEKLDGEQFASFYKSYGYNCTCKKFNLSKREFRLACQKYGVEKLSKEEINQIRRNTMEERYGGIGWGSSIISEKSRKTNLERYGVENTYQSEEKKEKIKQVLRERYGVEHPMYSETVKDKIRNTCREKYGVDNPSQSEDIKKKKKETCLKHYGVEYNSQSNEIKNKIIATCNEKYGIEWPCQLPQCRIGGSNDSSPNLRFKELLENNSLKFQREFALGKLSYDFKVNNVLIEIDPSITHSTSVKLFGKMKDKYYHLNKTELAKENGFRCIHIFDWDSMEKIIETLKPKQKIFARKCVLKEINQVDTDSFLNKYHLQNTCRNQTIRLGLYYDDELIQIMTFGKPRYNKKYEYELLRLCTKPDYIVIGGSEKIFKHFVYKYNPLSIISYCDNSKFNGDVYKKLGFKLQTMGEPSKHWYKIGTHQHITDNLLRQHGFDQLFGTTYGKGTSNEELMLQNKFIEVYDCGQSVYTYNSIKLGS